MTKWAAVRLPSSGTYASSLMRTHEGEITFLCLAVSEKVSYRDPCCCYPSGSLDQTRILIHGPEREYTSKAPSSES